MIMAKARLGELTAGEMREILPLRPVILLPLGSHEDQGPHAPMGDYPFAERVVERIATRVTAAGTPTFVAPVLTFGGADFFASMPGGISLSQCTLRVVLTDMLTCALRGIGSTALWSSMAMRATFRQFMTRPKPYDWKRAC